MDFDINLTSRPLTGTKDMPHICYAHNYAQPENVVHHDILYYWPIYSMDRIVIDKYEQAQQKIFSWKPVQVNLVSLTGTACGRNQVWASYSTAENYVL